MLGLHCIYVYIYIYLFILIPVVHIHVVKLNLAMDVDKLNQAAELDRNIFSRLINAALANPAQERRSCGFASEPQKLTACTLDLFPPSPTDIHSKLIDN